MSSLLLDTKIKTAAVGCIVNSILVAWRVVQTANHPIQQVYSLDKIYHITMAIMALIHVGTILISYDTQKK